MNEERNMKNKSKPSMVILVSVLLALAAGCATNPWPVVTQTAVFVGVRNDLRKHPADRPKLEVVKQIVCAVAQDTNANPAALVSAIDAAGPWSDTEGMALDLVVVAVNSGVAADPKSPAKVYLDSACAGLNLALASEPLNRGLRSHNAPPAVAGWPMAK